MRNTYKVPKRVWKKFGAKGQPVFNNLFFTMTKAPDLFMHPKATALKKSHWRTVAWNAAWIAASAAAKVYV